MSLDAVITLRTRVEAAAGEVARAGGDYAPVRRPARVALMLALAHRIERDVAEGELSDHAEAARRLGLTRARVTQLCDLTLLAPDIQEEILFLESVDGVEPLSERALRPIASELDWSRQREMWRVLQSTATTSPRHTTRTAGSGRPNCRPARARRSA